MPAQYEVIKYIFVLAKKNDISLCYACISSILSLLISSTHAVQCWKGDSAQRVSWGSPPSEKTLVMLTASEKVVETGIDASECHN